MRNATLFCLAASIVVLVVPTATTHAQVGCNGKVYVSADSTVETGVFELDPATGALTQVGDDSGLRFNAMGLNPVDGYLYAWKSGAPRGVIRIDENGDVTELGIPANVPDQQFVVGDVDANGIFYLHMTFESALYAIDLNVMPLSATVITVNDGMGTPLTTFIPDFAINPEDGLLYGMFDSGFLGGTTSVVTIDPTTGLFGGLNAGPMEPSFTAGGAWFGEDGLLYGASVDEVYSVDVSGAEADLTLVSNPRDLGYVDAARCAYPDTDDDGVVDVNDPDDDNDGIPDTTETTGDFDMDGVPNHLDLDSDGDGLTDALEGGATDTDGDGIPDGCVDTDTNGVCDSVDAMALPIPNTDGEGGPDYLDLDADGDGITDAAESGPGDSDGDGVPNGYLDANGNGINDNGNTNDPTDSDNDGTPDFQELDADDDGIVDATEGHDGNADGAPDTTPSGTDTDGDGIDDAFDPDNGGTVAPLPDADNDGTPNFQEVDSDGDGVNDADETGDANGNGTPDYLEAPGTTDGGSGLAGGSLGCTVGPADGSSITLTLLLVAAAYIRRRHSHTTGNNGGLS